jgi:hypothetical protein
MSTLMQTTQVEMCAPCVLFGPIDRSNTDCQKWAGVQADVDVLNPSGTNDADRVSCSIMCYFVLMLKGSIRVTREACRRNSAK